MLDLLQALVRRRAVRGAAALLAALGLASGSLPLLDAPGYELGEAGALLAALVLGPWLGIAAGRAARARPEPSPAAAAAAAGAVAAGLLGLLLAGALLRAALGPCSALAAAGFFPLLAVPSALLAAALGAAAAFLARGRAGPAAALYALVVLAALGVALRGAYAGPAAFAWSPLLGAWPGPLYDEALRVDGRVVLGALEATALAAAVAAAAELALRPRRTRRRLAGVLLALAAAAGAVAAARGARAALGLDGSRETVARALGGVREGPRCTLVLPSEKPEAAAAELLAECEFHVAEVARALGIERPPRVTVYVYRSAEEKRRLVGAAGTDFTKPWRAEIHLGDAPLPHPVLRHEVVHAVASALAPGPLRVPARAGVLVSAGLVEGLAVALEVPRGAWTVHEWSRAARDQGRLPDLPAIVGPGGFWSQAPARAYTAAGSFLAFLLARHGPAPVARAYATGDVAAALGRPLPALVDEWQRFLDGVAVPEGLRREAEARLARGSLFTRRCAREAAALEAGAGAAAAAGRTEEACDLYRRAGALTGSPWAAKARGDARARSGDLAGALAAYAEARAQGEGQGALQGALAAAEADVRWRQGDAAAAAAGWAAALGAGPDRGEARLLSAKLAALRDPRLAAAALPYLLGLGDATLALARTAAVDAPLAAYLVGRAHGIRGEAAPAAALLARAAAGGLPPELAAEARAAGGEAACAAGEVGAGEEALRAALARAGSEAERERLEAGLRRCAFVAADRAAAR